MFTASWRACTCRSASSAAGRRSRSGTSGVAGVAENGDAFGFNLAAAQIDGSGRDSLLVSVPFENLGGLNHVGQLTAFSTSTNGPVGTGSVTLEPDAPGVAGLRKANAEFGLVIE